MVVSMSDSGEVRSVRLEVGGQEILVRRLTAQLVSFVSRATKNSNVSTDFGTDFGTDPSG